ncbi:MAG: 2-succinyl-5-enolpyruvyl-6-hydroxy-3-cyclohexene-1-carboxylic-acid synthase [Wenzhouxiangellaceae bacterium]|nr:2-succinyl-5-enolpyruvyl-6-hydroxy-3-cyclohexene-1-carboxylic-acid synthase [Wenzhouxiangellaceae bacterium]
MADSAPGKPPPNVNTLWAQAIVDELARSGLRAVAISPGSRSAPLVFQFSRHPDIIDVSIIDERSAGFFALGMARALNETTALLCTSGTAAANFFPAVCEAAAAGIPLLVLTADRLLDDHDCGMQQVMDQDRLYGDRVRWFKRLAQPEACADKLAYVRSLAARAMAKTRAPQPGPVHLNIPFRKPLEPLAVDPGQRDHVPAWFVAGAGLPARGRPGGQPWITVSSNRPGLDDKTIDRLGDQVRRSQRPLIIAGANRDGVSHREALRDFAQRAGIPVMAEPASGLRHWSQRGPNIIGSGDLIASSAFYGRLGLPDLVIRSGHAPLSWPLQALLGSIPAATHVAISDSPALADPDHQVGWQIIADPAALFQRLAPGPDQCGPARAQWLQAHRQAQSAAVARLDALLGEQEAFSAPAMWRTLGSLLPENAALFFSSSMLVRHLDTFMCMHERSLDVHFNRGLNGIDGIVSTAAGLARGLRLVRSSSPMVLVIGDVALRHDLAALLLVAELKLDLTVIVVDNDGGEIFEYLPTAGLGPVHQKHFATSGCMPISQILPRGLDLAEPGDWTQFRQMVAASLYQPGLQIIRFATGRVHDRDLRRQLIECAAAAIDPMTCTASPA